MFSSIMEWFRPFVVCVLVCATHQSARADGASAPDGQADLAARVRELEETVRKLTQMVTEMAAKMTKPGADSAAVEKIVADQLKKQKPTAGYQNEFFVGSADGAFKLKLKGLIQADARSYLTGGGNTSSDSFGLRRVRPILEGTIHKNVDLRLMPDFGEGRTVLQDAYADLRIGSGLTLRAGKFKEPVSLDRLTGAADLIFIERSLTNNLLPNRDVGFQLSGETARGTLAYQVGAFNGLTDGGSTDGDTANDKDVAARIFAQPFKNQKGSSLSGLSAGVAASFGGRTDALTGVAPKTAARSTFFKYGAGVAGSGNHFRVVPQFSYYNGPLGLMGEYAMSQHGATKDALSKTLTHHGWFMQGSYVLTGEPNSLKSVTPKRPFEPGKGGGAVEIAARYSTLDLDQDLFTAGFADATTPAAKAHAITLGVNWHLYKGTKWQFNYERTNFSKGIKFGADIRDHEDVFLSRLQIAF